MAGQDVFLIREHWSVVVFKLVPPFLNNDLIFQLGSLKYCLFEH